MSADDEVRLSRFRPALRPARRRSVDLSATGGPMKLKLDLHEIYNRGHDIDRALYAIMDEAARTRAPLVEIIPGKGSGQLKKHVLRFLDQPEIKKMYHRVEKDSKNFGRVFVHFRWK
jgi:DNA-nicking Smr family endonuclease